MHVRLYKFLVINSVQLFSFLFLLVQTRPPAMSHCLLADYGTENDLCDKHMEPIKNLYTDWLR